MKFINFIVVEKLKIYKLCRCTVTILDEARIFHFKYGAKYICQGEGKGITIGRKMLSWSCSPSPWTSMYKT